MPKQNVKVTKSKPEPKEDYGKLLMTWTIKEYKQYKRTFNWYLVALFFAVLFLVYAIWTFNFLFAVIIVLVGIIVYLHSKRQPHNMKINVWEDGVEIGDTFYPYKAIKKFWIIYEPPEVKNLYFEVDQFFRPEISLYLGQANPIQLRDILLKYIEEDLDQENESSADFLSRKLKI